MLCQNAISRGLSSRCVREGQSLLQPTHVFYVFLIKVIVCLLHNPYDMDCVFASGPLWGESTSHLKGSAMHGVDGSVNKLLYNRLYCRWFVTPCHPYDVTIILRLAALKPHKHYKVFPASKAWKCRVKSVPDSGFENRHRRKRAYENVFNRYHIRVCAWKQTHHLDWW